MGVGLKNAEAAVRKIFNKAYGFTKDYAGVDVASPLTFSEEFTVTLAQLNAGHVLIPGEVARTLKVVGFFIQFTGAFATLDDIRLSDTSSSPVDIVTIAQAQAGNGVVHSHVSGTNTKGAGFMADLAAGQGIQLRKTGATGTGGTSVLVHLLYRITG